ncbi:MAG: hypothetical protein AB2L20_07560 [Mangrovibacterium sp.]
MKTRLLQTGMSVLWVIISSGIFTTVRAQEGFKYFILKGGTVYQDAWTGTAGIGFVTRYHNSFELSFNYYRYKTDYENYLLGLFYKPVISRNKNATLKFRIGSHVGTDNSDFIFSALGGLEFLQSLSGGLDLVFSGTGGYYFNGHNGWRIAGEVGLRFSF